MRRSFLVCFWYDFSAAWKIAWKGDSEEAEVMAVVEADMTRDGRNGLYALRGKGADWHRLSSLSGSLPGFLKRRRALMTYDDR